MSMRYRLRGPSCGPLTAAAILATALMGSVAPAAAQVGSGISLGLTPSAERLSWSDDLALNRGWYYGGRASLNFGRFVALEGYYLEGDDVRPDAPTMIEDARRYGGDVVFTFADRALSPFVRVGAGLSEFGIQDGSTSEILTGTAAAGLRLDLFDRLQTQVFAQDVAFRASGSSPIVAAGAVPEGETETFHNLALGVGANLYLGGRPNQSETDGAFTGGLRGVASPLELYGGEVRWSDALGLPDLPVAGARLGLNFGPYVGLRAYYFGSAENDFDEFTDYYGYGAEGRFNLTRSDEAITPFVVLGGGRIHFSETALSAAGFEDETKWNAVAGGGVGFNVTERFRIEASARDLILSTTDPENVTAPDQLEHSWVYSAGLSFSIGGDTGRPEAPRPMPPTAPPAGSPTGIATAESAGSTGSDAAPMSREEPDSSAVLQEIRSLRAEVDSLRTEMRDSAGGVRPSVRTMELPLLEQGEIYVRFGESGTFERTGDGVGTDLRTLMAMERIAALREDARQAPPGAERDSLMVRLRDLEDRLGTGLAGGADSEPNELRRLEARIDSLQGARASQASQPTAEEVRLRAAEQRMQTRIEQLERQLDQMEGAARPANETQAVFPGERGVLRGDPFRLLQLSPFTGPGFGEPGRLHLGAKADLGSAFGGPGRFVPQLSVGLTDEFVWSANAHVEWPIVRIGEAQPYIGTGFGLRDDGGLGLLFPNVIVGTTYPVGNYQLFGAIEGLDWFDDTRLVIGIQALEGLGGSAR